MKFHEKLYELRKKAGMTQNDLAEKLNVSRQAVSRWEMGTAMPDVDNLVTMSDLFVVSLDYLLKDEPGPAQQDHDPAASQEELATKEPEQKGSWLLIPIVVPLIGLSLLINGWLFEKDILCSIGFFMLGASLAALIVVLVVLFVRFCIKRLKS